MRIARLAAIIIFCVSSIIPAVVFARVSVNVPIGDPSYRMIDRMVAGGLVKNIVVGQRPYTRMEVAGFLVEAKKNFEHLSDPGKKLVFLKLIDYWSKEFSNEIAEINKDQDHQKTVYGRGIDSLDITADYLTSIPRPIPPAPSGSLDATVSSLVNYTGGRLATKGETTRFESTHWLSTPYFALFINPQMQAQLPNEGYDETDKPYLQSGYIKTGIGKLELQIGRDELVWGGGELGGLALSINARPLDMMKLSTSQPVALPASLGNIKYSLVVANMGPSYSSKYASMTGMKFSWAPVDVFELGLAYDAIMGGRAEPEFSTMDGIRETFGFIPGVSKGGQYSLRNGGVDVRFRIPPAFGMELYAEALTTDFKTGQMSYMGGIYIPSIGRADHIFVRGEYVHTSTGTYRSNTYTSGYSLSHQIVGHPIGPGADGYSLTAGYDMGVRSSIRLSGAYERYRAPDPESRFRGMFLIDTAISERIFVNFLFGGEHIQNYGFVKGDDRNEWYGCLGLSIDTM